MFKYCFPWLALTLVALFRSFKTKVSDFELFSFCMVASYLIPLSFMKWKLSHYILPIYPFMAYISANQLCRFFDNKQLNLFFKIITVLLTLLGGIYAFTDVGGKIKRDASLIKILNSSKLEGIKNIAILNHSLPKWSSIGTIEFHLKDIKGHYLITDELGQMIKDNTWLLISNVPFEYDGFSLLKNEQGLFIYKN